MNKGKFEKLYKAAMEHLHGNVELMGIYAYLVSSQAYGDYLLNKRSKHMVKKGDIYTTYLELAEKLGCNRKTAAKWVLELEVLGLIKVSKKGREFIIINLAEDGELSTPRTIQERRIVHPTDNPNGELSTPRTIQPIPSLLEETNLRQDYISPPSSKLDPLDLTLGEDWLRYAKLATKLTAPPQNWTIENFAKDLAKTQKLAGISRENLRDILIWVSNPACWWYHLATSPAALLTKKSASANRKIENICIAMERDKNGYNDNPKRNDDYDGPDFGDPSRYANSDDSRPW